MHVKSTNQKPADFVLDEVVELKGFLFKIVLIDAFTGKIGLKQISKEEAELLNNKSSS